MTTPQVHSTHLSAKHSFSKDYSPSIQLIAGVGVHGDCHSGSTIQATAARKKNPDAPNYRQIHLLHGELFAELAHAGFAIAPGELGENVTTWGLDLLNLPRGAYLYFGDGGGDENAVPVVQVTGLRNPGKGIEKHKKGLLGNLLIREKGCKTVRKAGVMGIVVRGGIVKGGDVIKVGMPEGEHVALEPV
jgi:MOSC domain-containing protein YiiM